MVSHIEKHIIVVRMPQPGPTVNDPKGFQTLGWIHSVQKCKMCVDVESLRFVPGS